MIAVASLVLLGVVSWLYRISFTAILDRERLPEVLRVRLDAVAPAAFAALVVAGLRETPGPEVAPMLVAVVAAAAAARLAGNHAVTVIAAAIGWSLASLAV